MLILAAVAAGLAVFWVLRPSKRVRTEGNWASANFEASGLSHEQYEEMQNAKMTLVERSLPGEEPDPRPQLEDFVVTTEVNTSTGKNLLCFYITEKHQYYAESFRIHFWHTGEDRNARPEESRLSRYEYLNKYLKAGDTLRYCMELVPAELGEVGGHIGVGRDWAAEIVWFHRARERNPDPLPDL